jgi:BRCT domain type II-containing protein
MQLSDSDDDVILSAMGISQQPPAAASKPHKQLLGKDCLPPMNFEGFIIPSAHKLCFQGMTFCVTGVFPQLVRDDLQQVVLTYGGKMGASVNSKTDYLLLGDTLENGDAVTASSKYRAASEHGVPTLTLDSLLQLLGSMPAQGESNANMCRACTDCAHTNTHTLCPTPFKQ